MQKCFAKYEWNYRNLNAHCAEDVKNMVQSLMETQAIDDDAISQLKTDSYPSCSPSVIMDLRHKTKHNNRCLINYKNKDAIKDAKRLIKVEELEKLTIEKELQSIDTQINSFQKDLDCYKLKMKSNFEIKQKRISSTSRQCEASRISAADVEDLLVASLSYNERLLKNKHHIVSSNFIPGFSNTQMNTSTADCSSHPFDSRNMGCIEENTIDTDDHIGPLVVSQDSNALLDNQALMIKTWNLWRAFIMENKLIKSNQQEENFLNSNTNTEEMRRLLRKYFIQWHKHLRKEQLLVKDNSEKTEQKQKVNKFLEMLQERKQIIKEKNKSFNGIKSKSANSINEFSLDAGGNQRKDNVNKHKSKILPYHLSNASFRHRFQAQQNIIAEQKAKLEEQKRIIEELRLVQLNKEIEKSGKKTHEHLSETLQNCSTVLKTKAKYLCRSMPSAIERVSECNSRRYVVPSLTVQPTFLSRMAERAQERQKRWKLIQEKKRIQKEDKERYEREKEEQRQQKEKEERTLVLEEIRNVKIIQKEKEIKKQQEKERLRALNHKASEYFKMYLLRKYGICAFRKIIELRDRSMENAADYYRKKLLFRHFIVWKMCVQNYIEWKMCKADNFYKKHLMRSAFKRFKKIYSDYKVKNQVALDFYDFHLQKWAFMDWHSVVCHNHIERITKMQNAKLHFERKLLTRCLFHWIKFPEILQKEKQRELRKEFWRSKVQELLPDFRPILPASEIMFRGEHLF